MKRCPQCEFIYEDDQSLCDMDGILLVFDSQQLPKPTQGNTKPQGRGRLVTALATLVLATVLYLVYYVSTHQQPAGPRYTPASNSTVQPQQSTAVTADEKTVNVTATKEDKETEETKAGSQPPKVKTSKEEKAKTNAAPNPKAVKESNEKPKVKATQKTQKPAHEDSKIGSFLKKTGRILKKPFKF